MNDLDIRLTNEAVLSGQTTNHYGIRKEAQEGVDEFLRLRVREDGFIRKQFNVQDITPSQLTKQQDTPLPVKVKDMEPNSAGAVGVPF